MQTIIEDLRYKSKRVPVEVGQVRANKDGRVVAVIVDRRLENGHVNQTLRAMIVKEAPYGSGNGVPFETIPMEYTFKEMEEDFPILLESKLSFWELGV